MVEEHLLRFDVPEIREIKTYLVELEDGTYVARTEEELEKDQELRARLEAQAGEGEG